MYQVQAKGERVVAMVLKELPAKKASSEGNPLLTVTTKLVREQQESRPLLSPSIDDFLLESRSDAPSTRPLTSNTAVLSTALDLVDLSEPADCSDGARSSNKDQRTSPLRRKDSRSPRRRTRPDQTELIQVEHLPARPRTPERTSQDSGAGSTPPRRWDEVKLDVEDGGLRRRRERRCTSHHSSSELLWSTEFQTDPLTKNSSDAVAFASSPQQHRRTRSLLAGNESLEAEFFRAKAAVESDTEFWDKMQAEWEELARRNWLEESEDQGPPTATPAQQSYCFSTNNPYKDAPSAFSEAQGRAREGDLNAAVLLLEAAILQDPQDSEAWQVLGTTQAENENEQAAISALRRCLELRPNNLPALMALAVSFTNSGEQRGAGAALRRWLSHNPRYKHLVPPHRGPRPPTSARYPYLHPITHEPQWPYLQTHNAVCVCRAELQDVLLLFQEAAVLNLEEVDPDLQTGLGVLFNLGSDFSRAVEAFSAALSVRPQDYLLWNRLGATLANGDRSEEAVEAYTRALELQPGFIRCRYNLGISCINLGAHREAVSNFLTALNQQRRSQQCSHQQMSANIWAALRIAVSMMDRPELIQAANAGDLDLLTRTFEVDDV
ncbi:PEX5-related protein isoform 2-T2 [Spinachia spinachia]